MSFIEKYSFGFISIDGRKFDTDLIIYPDRIDSDWWRKEPHRLQLEDIRDVLANPPEALIVGLGDYARMKVDPRLNQILEKMNVLLFAAPTREACAQFNKLSSQGAKVVAALHLTC